MNELKELAVSLERLAQAIEKQSEAIALLIDEIASQYEEEEQEPQFPQAMGKKR